MIRVNRTVIDDDAIRAEAVRMGDGPTGLEAARWTLVVRALLVQEAERLGLLVPGADRDEAAAVEALLAQEVRVPEPEESECRRYYTCNPRRFRTPTRYEVSHILLAAAPDDAEARAQAHQTARHLIDTLAAAPERFAALARRHSACPSAAQGGSLGCIDIGQTVPEFDKVLVSLAPGLCPTPVESRFGWHVVRLDRRLPGRTIPYDEARPRIAAYLRERSWRQAVHQYLSILAGRAEIDGITVSTAETPLVQ